VFFFFFKKFDIIFHPLPKINNSLKIISVHQNKTGCSAV